VPIHGVLVQWNQQIDPVTHVGDRFGAGANRQEGVTAPNNGLIGVVGIQAEAPPAKDLGENIARRGHTLARSTSNGDRKGLFHGTLIGRKSSWQLAATLLHKLRAWLEGRVGFPRKIECMGISACSI